MAKSYRDLVVWQKAIVLTTLLYRLTQLFPREEIYGLISQLRRAGGSVASNIAEGSGRGTKGEYRRFLGVARGSALEIQTQLIVVRELGYGEPKQVSLAEQLAEEISRMFRSLSHKL